MVAGAQFPITPFGAVLFKIGAAEPKQIGAIGAKFGGVIAFTVTVKTNVAELTHSPAAAVNV